MHGPLERAEDYGKGIRKLIPFLTEKGGKIRCMKEIL
jgi:hypothetical protein